MFATSAMRYIHGSLRPGRGYGVALNVDCKTMPRPFLILSHFPYFCNTRVHFLALTTGACYLSLPRLRVCVARNIFLIARDFSFFLFFLVRPPAPVSRAFSLRTDVSERSLCIQYPNFRRGGGGGGKEKKHSTTATELNLGSTVRDLFYPPLH